MAATDTDKRQGLLDELAAIRDELRPMEERRDALYARRLELFAAARAMDPPITNQQIAAAAGITTPRVTNQLARLRPAEAT